MKRSMMKERTKERTWMMFTCVSVFDFITILKVKQQAVQAPWQGSSPALSGLTTHGLLLEKAGAHKRLLEAPPGCGSLAGPCSGCSMCKGLEVHLRCL